MVRSDVAWGGLECTRRSGFGMVTQRNLRALGIKGVGVGARIFYGKDAWFIKHALERGKLPCFRVSQN